MAWSLGGWQAFGAGWIWGRARVDSEGVRLGSARVGLGYRG